MFGKYEHIAIRAFDSGFDVGDTMPNSFVWVDGECTDEELNGACGVKVADESDIKSKLNSVREMYAFSGRVIYVIAGDFAEFGQDDGEIIIRKAKVIKVIA